MARPGKPFGLGAGVAASASAALLAMACVDVFHGLDDLKNACGQTAPCDDAGAEDANVRASNVATSAADFCLWDAATARAHAEHACAWLGACESPMGQNQLGACMTQAILAYDCAANATMKVTGQVKTYWDALSRVTTCADVYAVTFTRSVCKPKSGPFAPFSACLANEGSLDGRSNTRVECLTENARATGERCVASGQSCVTVDGAGTEGRCVGGDRVACAETRCEGTKLHACSPSRVDLGRECAGFGAGRCTSNDAGAACVPTSTAGACTPSRVVTCVGATAVGCAAGVPETVACDAVLGPSAKCVSGTTLAPGDAVVTACAGTDGKLQDGAALDDACDGDTVISSAQGTKVSVDCKAQTLGPCALVTTMTGRRAACSRPRDGG